jgi:hypothetical protein
VTDHRTLNLPIPNGKTPMVVQCGSDECSHIWVIAWLPMPLENAARVMKDARCPLCANGQVYVASTAQMEARGLQIVEVKNDE